MSFRKMLKVSLLMLLAMALAATTAHARFDLFGKLRTSQNQPNPNSAEGVLQLLVKGKGNSNVDDESGRIPYTECIKTCDSCFCTIKWPPESNVCICGDNSKSKKRAAAVQQVESSRSKVKSETIPYSECIENCTGSCACTLIFPPELAQCICLESTTAKAAEGVPQLLVKGKGKSNVDDESGAIPYTECIKTCDTCFCTMMWPPESNVCICGDNSKSKKLAAAVQQVESSRSKVKSETISYSECLENCKGTCACTLIYPPELAQCICLESTTAKATEGVPQLLVKGKGKSNVDDESGAIPYTECIKTCDTCFCTMMWPPESNMCICGDNSKSKKPTAAVQQVESSTSKVKSETIPYSECIENCTGSCACTLIFPPELAQCICLESTTAKAAEKLHKKLDLLSKPAAISGEGWLPYPECIEKCDECVVCTRIYPIELAYCYCGKNTTSNSKKLTIQNLVQKVESSRSKVKSETMPYSECMENCKGTCACTAIWPPELSMCFCFGSIESTTAKAVEKLHKKLDLVSKPVAILKEGWLPYPECIEKCDECVVCTRVYPIELAYCYCGKNTTSNIKKLAIQNSEIVEESHKKLDLVSKTVAISAEGFLPYPECIEQCDECVICTRVYPIEKALCYCGKKTTSNFQKWPIKNLGDDIKVVMWTKVSSKAAGRALPI